MNWKLKGQFDRVAGLLRLGLGLIRRILQGQFEEHFRSRCALRGPMYRTQRQLGRCIAARLRQET
jgi:hypothetical protein